MIKKLITVALAGLPTVAWAAYGLSLGSAPIYPPTFTHFGYTNPNAPKGGSFSLPISGGFDTLNPFTLKGDHEAGITSLTLDTLTAQSWDEPFAVYGLLAEDIELASDGLSVNFKINPKARFQNGDPVLAQDVAASFKLLTQDPAASPSYRFYWADVAGVDITDKYTVRFRFKNRNAELHMILGQLPVFSHKSYPQGLAKAPNTPPIGSGPYRLSRTESGRLSEFTRDKNYWAQNLPTRKGMYNFDRIRFNYVRDNSVRLEGIKGGRYDFSQETTARDWARAYPENLLARHYLQKHEWQHQNTAGMQGFVMNQRRSFFQDVRVRQALVFSFDFESINERLFYGSYRRSDSYFTNSEMAAAGKPQGRELELLLPLKNRLPPAVFNLDAPQPPKVNPSVGIRPNLMQAKALLLAAGYRYQGGRLIDKNQQPVVIEYLTPSKNFERVVLKWQRDLAKIGITLNIRVTDAALYQKRVNDFDFDIVSTVYANSESPGNEQFGYYSCQSAKTPGSRNLAGICDPAIESLLPNFAQFKNRADLVASARALDRVLRWQYLVIPNWHSNQYRVIYRNTLGIPARPPKYYAATEWALSTWWDKAAQKQQ
ncbi:MAG: extracellular solute-binding protein [Neisseria sp.]|uniref:extracellular solute-binding protein n=1 Tax=Neisseria sp. TaxID=192066 RepID=UPI0026DBD992|nr:extracellular solute-binding protein [Neisseria sp.]MDO4249019.1 extracellular solute-binding protein [Neisseria sp.]